ncbi:unnamed protein product [Paramecium sonneborni]|uniref:Uncharacterized protein n=1 Tax=Paramecium sonneborni TaxID=65129 RepID=A0A8S1MQE1_9CILI|nr:unnamed protein product [Paramecium sonneborni]
MQNKKNDIPFHKQQSYPNINPKNNQQEEIYLEELITYSKKANTTIFLKEYQLNQAKNIYFIIRILLKGKDEQKLFETYPDLIFLLRRGLTILYLDNNYSILRKGLPKFYDFQSEKVKNENQFLRKNQLHKAYQSLKQKIPVTIVQQQQENGDNFQISFSSILQTWVISSKNDSIFCKNYEDYLQNCPNKDIDYQENFPWLIAKIWFSQMIDKNVEQLQKDLTDFTFVGEFVHNSFFIHIIEYQQPALIFFALINNHVILNYFFCKEIFVAIHNKQNIWRINIIFILQKQNIYMQINKLYQIITYTEYM